jgi:hypothetical protein
MENQLDVTDFSPSQAVVTLHGASREIYGFTPLPIDAAPARPGIFAYAGIAEGAQRATRYWDLFYVGSAGSIAERGDWLAEAKRQGATHILVHFCRRGEDSRRFVEEDLVAAVSPPLNALERQAQAA